MTAFTLKTIALVSMLIDHLGVAFPLFFPLEFRAIGRLAWPIFAYFIAEGFRHTQSKEKFLMRLFAFAVISEIPYDLAMGNSINFLANTNIFYTLFIGGVAICLYEKMKTWGLQTLGVISALFPTVLLAEFLTVDYGGMGVLFIFAMYAIKPMRFRLAAMCGFALVQFTPLLMAHSLGIEIRLGYMLMLPFALASVWLVAKYNGQRGRKMKWLFYIAYPAHLAVLVAVSAIVGVVGG